MKNKVIYLSGPMTGLPEFNYPLFNLVAKKLREMGNIVYNPAEYDVFDNQQGKNFPIRQAFAEYSAFICNRADTIVMLEGWENSKGATCEKLLAENCKLDVVLWRDLK